MWQQQLSQLTKVEAAAAGQEGWRQRLQPTAVGSTTNTTTNTTTNATTNATNTTTTTTNTTALCQFTASTYLFTASVTALQLVYGEMKQQ